jgi:hypothetical protein
MKKNIIALLSICSIMLTSCQKEPPETAEKTIAAKILGKWMLVKHSEETFSATNNLIYNTERIGDGSDSLIFRANGRLLIYSNTDGNYIENYQVVNDKTLRIEKEDWTISLLDDKELNLISEEIDANTKERDVAKAFFKRP